MATEPAIGTRIKRARERLRWSQQRLADELKVNRKTVDNWENGRTSPRSSIGALEELFGVHLDDTTPPRSRAIPKSLVRDVMENPELRSDEEREAVLDAIEERLARERGGAAASSPVPAAEQERHRPAS